MKKARFIIEQIELSKELLLKNDECYYRIAFVLLDNSAEILMHRICLDKLFSNNMNRRLRDSAKKNLDEKKFNDWEKNYHTISIIDENKERKIKKYFNEKIDYLSEDQDYLEKETASVLKSLHKYRNEMYHNDKVREKIIRASTILLFEIVCDLLNRLKPSVFTWISNENYETDCWSSFFKRYDIKNHYFDDRDYEKIIKKIKNGISINLIELRSVLKINLLSRINNAIEDIKFIRTNSYNELHNKSNEKTLKFIQLVDYIEKNNLSWLVDFNIYLKEFRPKYCMENFNNWKREVNSFNNINNKIELFKKFSTIENDFEVIESQINRIALELDKAIQMEEDAARGK
ncbi:MAG: hypothetical protein ACYCXK_07120 [Candidatus Humimicrobiaceae bacterium]